MATTVTLTHPYSDTAQPITCGNATSVSFSRLTGGGALRSGQILRNNALRGERQPVFLVCGHGEGASRLVGAVCNPRLLSVVVVRPTVDRAAGRLPAGRGRAARSGRLGRPGSRRDVAFQIAHLVSRGIREPGIVTRPQADRVAQRAPRPPLLQRTEQCPLGKPRSASRWTGRSAGHALRVRSSRASTLGVKRPFGHG